MFSSSVSLVDILTFVVGIVIPLIVGIITKVESSASVKAVVLIVVSFVTSIINELITSLTGHVPYDIGQGILKFGAIAVVAIASYFGFWSRPTKSGVSVAHRVNKVGVK